MKPWEGKHWKKTWEMIEKEVKIREFLEAHCLYWAAGNLKQALEKDWEESKKMTYDSNLNVFPFSNCFVCDAPSTLLWNDTLNQTITPYCDECISRIRMTNNSKEK